MKKIFLALIIQSCIPFIICAQSFNWVNSFGVNYNESIKSIKTDASGNIYALGKFGGVVDFDPGPLTFNMNYLNGGVFVLKLDGSGNFIWARQFAGTSTVEANCLDIDGSQNIYITGNFANITDFDPGIATYNMSPLLSSDAFILKLDNSGNFVWAEQLNADFEAQGFSLSCYGGNVVITGHYRNTADFDPGIGTHYLTSNGYFDAFILKLDGSGNFIWVKSVGSFGLNEDAGLSSAIDNTGNEYVSGYFKDTVDFDPGIGTYNLISPNGGHDAFILKLDVSGNFIWARNFGGTNDDFGGAIEVDQYGQCYSTGQYQGLADFDPGVGVLNLNSVGQYNFYVLKLSSIGNLLWARGIPALIISPLTSTDIAIDNYGNSYTTGYFQDSLDFDPGIAIQKLTSDGIYDGFLLKLDPAGNYTNAFKIGGNGYDNIQNIEINNNGDIVIAGPYTNTVDFDPTNSVVNLTSVGGSSDIFIEKLTQDACDNLALVFDSASSGTCSSLAYVAVHGANGIVPYSYNWNTIPVILDSVANITTSGIYNVTVSDNNGCTRTRTVLTFVPSNISAFDLDANMIPLNNFRINSSTNILLNAYNNGCLPASGSLKLVLDNLLNFNTASPSPDAISGDTLIWNFNSWTSDSLHFQPVINVSPSASSNIGDSICLKTIIEPIVGDVNPLNNNKSYCYLIQNSLDPNSKVVFPQGECAQHYILKNEPVSVVIRFQNCGNTSASNIYIIDTLPSSIDINSLLITTSSHNVFTEVINGNILKFNFININLPDSNSNELLSHGYIIYQCNSVTGLPSGTIVNFPPAQIYFDFNAAILTGGLSKTFVDVIPQCITGIALNPGNENDFIIYPNPVTENLKIINKTEEINVSFQVVNSLGECILKSTLEKGINNINMNLPSGIYLVQIKSQKSNITQKLIVFKNS